MEGLKKAWYAISWILAYLLLGGILTMPVWWP